MKSILRTGLLLLGIAGCAVGPDYQKPTVNAPEHFRGQPANSATNSLADLLWVNVYGDPVLQALVREALTNNLDLRIAISRVEQSRQLAGQSRALFFPSVTYDGGVSRGRNEA